MFASEGCQAAAVLQAAAIGLPLDVPSVLAVCLSALASVLGS